MPKSIGNLSVTLEQLRLNNNALSGTLPTSIAYLINLEALSIRGNKTSGVIPHEIGNLKMMKQLEISPERSHTPLEI